MACIGVGWPYHVEVREASAELDNLHACDPRADHPELDADPRAPVIEIHDGVPATQYYIALFLGTA